MSDTNDMKTDETRGLYHDARERALRAFETTIVTASLRAHHGNLTRVAEHLGITRTSLYQLVRRNGIDPKAFIPRRPRPPLLLVEGTTMTLPWTSIHDSCLDSTRPGPTREKEDTMATNDGKGMDRGKRPVRDTEEAPGTIRTLVRLPNGEIVEEVSVPRDTVLDIARDAWDALLDALAQRAIDRRR